MSRRNATFWSKVGEMGVGETGVGEQGISRMNMTPLHPALAISWHLKIVIPTKFLQYYDY